MMTPLSQARLQKYPSISDLQKRAKQRLPLVAWEYLDMGTGEDIAVSRNRVGLDRVTLQPQFLKGLQTQSTETTLFGRTYAAPFGVAPVGLTGLMWPNAEKILAKAAAQYQFPYCLSTAATQTPETIGALVDGMGWFQLYPPRDETICDDLLKRARDNDFHTLVVTADVPAASRRERTSRAGLRMPPSVTPYFVLQALQHPKWTAATLRNGLPRLRTVEKYAEATNIRNAARFVGEEFGGTLSWEYLQRVRDLWDGPIVLKGILHPSDAETAISMGIDGIGVSNHGGRQFDAAPAAIDVLPTIAELVNGRAKIIFDSGIRSGADVIRALALGADFVLAGRAFMFGVAAFGESGGIHAAEILLADLKTNMAQLGVTTIDEVKQLEPTIDNNDKG
ncbi:MAG: alpha-hydroxy acid oxidase [Chloroflexota bacterium]